MWEEEKNTTKKESWKNYRRNAIKQFYEGIHRVRTGFQPRTTMCRNKQGIIVGREVVLEVWATYFKELLNPQTNGTTQETTYYGSERNIGKPILQETLTVIRNSKNNRAPGEDSITLN